MLLAIRPSPSVGADAYRLYLDEDLNSHVSRRVPLSSDSPDLKGALKLDTDIQDRDVRKLSPGRGLRRASPVPMSAQPHSSPGSLSSRARLATSSRRSSRCNAPVFVAPEPEPQADHAPSGQLSLASLAPCLVGENTSVSSIARRARRRVPPGNLAGAVPHVHSHGGGALSVAWRLGDERRRRGVGRGGRGVRQSGAGGSRGGEGLQETGNRQWRRRGHPIFRRSPSVVVN